MIGTIAAPMAEGCVSGKHQHAPQQMRQKLWLRFLGLAETRQYTLEQRHEAPLFSVGLENTTLEDECLCGYLSPKTVRSIADIYDRGKGSFSPDTGCC
jgi:hypothetical protein